MTDKPIAETEPPDTAQGRRTFITAAFLALVCLGLAVAAGLFFRPAAKPAPAAPLAVQVIAAAVAPTPVVLQAVGKVTAQASVEVRPQTSGVLRKVWISEGQRVVAGQRLFELDAQPLKATLAQAQAQYARDLALADDAAAAQARLEPLANQEFVTAREYESAVSSQRTLRAAAAATRTQIEQARIALGYANITTPIAGRAGAVLVKPGNLVSSGNGTALVVINALSPVDIAFSLPQDDARRLRQAMKAGDLDVEARDSRTQALRAKGRLVFFDNALNDASGTILLKARFANADEALWPGEFHAVRIVLGMQDDAVLIPERALQQGQAGAYVYVVDGNKARIRQLKVDRVLDGQAVIASGLRGGEMVVLAVPASLRDGTAVTPQRAASQATAAVATVASVPTTP
ncbi:efflux RND transporter periplasmic adaptor subunit [Cupriavidus basilensis]|uniref:Efflux RND transporter periplasmic adaptor subunit n=1 Tax=Cupriavidus basilensis TaxID=68895 RepID=A0ABT6AIM4_9BURK|nr:efflux RND transporter periplasmic adaptor subunit [Cupriavidus basilensis]MDF3832463.1 efflux RND transporter periplasmic adaptor subunit [Cupriavidus basilensis]